MYRNMAAEQYQKISALAYVILHDCATLARSAADIRSSDCESLLESRQVQETSRIFAGDTIDVLLAAFAMKKKPNAAEKHLLAQKTGLKDRQISVWVSLIDRAPAHIDRIVFQSACSSQEAHSHRCQ